MARPQRHLRLVESQDQAHGRRLVLVGSHSHQETVAPDVRGRSRFDRGRQALDRDRARVSRGRPRRSLGPGRAHESTHGQDREKRPARPASRRVVPAAARARPASVPTARSATSVTMAPHCSRYQGSSRPGTGAPRPASRAGERATSASARRGGMAPRGQQPAGDEAATSAAAPRSPRAARRPPRTSPGVPPIPSRGSTLTLRAPHSKDAPGAWPSRRSSSARSTGRATRARTAARTPRAPMVRMRRKFCSSPVSSS